MRIRHLLIIVAITASFVSCFKDDTTLGTGILSEITIDNISEVYNINLNDTLTIAPHISQTGQEKSITYTWEINLQSDSIPHLKSNPHDKVFIYVGKDIGSYKCRLIVENEDGKTFFPFVINVNTLYEEGLTLISKGPNGKAMLSFMLTPFDSTITPNFMQGDQFATNNEEPFADNPVDIVQSSGQLIIACQGNDTSLATIYCLNEKTFVLENTISDPEYPEFKPTILGIPGNTYGGSAYPIISADGSTYEFSPSEGALTSPIKLPYTYAQTAITYTKGSGKYDFLCWDKEFNALCMVYDGYGPYYCAKKYHTNRAAIAENAAENIFNGFEICKMVLVEQTGDIITLPRALVITKNASDMFQKSLISVDFWESSDEGTKLIDEGLLKMCGYGIQITEITPCVANHTYLSMLFSEGNKVRRWYYTTENTINNAEVLQTVGSESAIITSMVLSADHTKTYVAFYEPESTEELNGSVWIIDTDKGTVLEKYDNVCYQPVKMIYKKK